MTDEHVESQVVGIKAIKQYFESGKHGHKVALDELKVTPPAVRTELAEMCTEAIEKGWD